MALSFGNIFKPSSTSIQNSIRGLTDTWKSFDFKSDISMPEIELANILSNTAAFMTNIYSGTTNNIQTDLVDEWDIWSTHNRGLPDTTGKKEESMADEITFLRNGQQVTMTRYEMMLDELSLAKEKELGRQTALKNRTIDKYADEYNKLTQEIADKENWLANLPEDKLTWKGVKSKKTAKTRENSDQASETKKFIETKHKNLVAVQEKLSNAVSNKPSEQELNKIDKGVNERQKAKTMSSPSDNIEARYAAREEWLKQGGERKVTQFILAPQENKEYVRTETKDILTFPIPDWGYDDFINERALFQKSIQPGVSEMGWFYFKIFFNFDTQYGLLGGLLNNKDPRQATNTAYKYLENCQNRGRYERTIDRQDALMRFARTLSYISTVAPWFFKSIKNLNQTQVPLLTEFGKERSIEIECLPDAIDMRLNMLLDLYRFAVYDEMNFKEVIPDNLRKFDMTVMVFGVPIRYFHTAFRTSDGKKFPYKRFFDASSYANMMSFKMYTFINCEIDPACLGNMVPGSMSNEQPFNMGGGSIKITYDRVYTHMMNEFNYMLFGSDGIYYDGALVSDTETMSTIAKNDQADRLQAISDAIDNPMKGDKASRMYKYMVDASESICTHNYNDLGLNALGNILGGEKTTHAKKINGKLEFSNSAYLNLKLQLLKASSYRSTDSFKSFINNVSSEDKFVIDMLNFYRKSRLNENSYLLGWRERSLATDEGQEYWSKKLRALKGTRNPGNVIKELANRQWHWYGANHRGITTFYDGTLNKSASAYYYNKLYNLKKGTIK